MPTEQEVMGAAQAAAAEALASDAGPDGLPSRRARQKAKKILDLVRDPLAVAQLAREVTGGEEGE